MNSKRVTNIQNELLSMLWVEKYRPKTIDEMVLSDNQKAKFKDFIDKKEIPNLLLYGKQGTGKTTLSKVLTSHIESDVMEINGSSENGVDDVRDKIQPFLSRMSDKKWIIIVIDEADYLSTNAQKALLNLIEEVSEYGRFIFKCNDINKIIPPLQSRLQKFNLQSEDNKISLVDRIKYILTQENVEYDPLDLVTIFDNCYPDIREIIQQLTQNTIDKQLSLDESSKASSSFIIQVDNILSKYKVGFKGQKPYIKNDLRSIKQSIVNGKVTDFKVLFDFLYDIIDNNEYVKDEDVETYLELFVILGEHNINHLRCINKEIDVLSLLSKIMNKLQKVNN